jgi:hypothetical protein
MSQQPELTSHQLAMSPTTKPGLKPVSTSPADPSPGKHAPQRIPPWLESTELFLRTFVLMFIGLAICIAPWSGQIVTYYPEMLNYFPHLREFWDQNPLFVQFPMLSIYASNGAVRGIVSGLGLLNLWIAFHNALRNRDGRMP